MTDASGKTGLGYQVLQIGEDNQMHAISYGSQALTESQRNWTVSQLELGAIVAALRAYECFAIHREVTIITDNSHCLALDKWLPANARERRMIAYLMQFRLKVKYIERCKNAPADALSRTLEDMSPETRLEFAPELNIKDDFIVSIAREDATELLSDQMSDISERERERESYRLTPSFTNLPSCSDGEIINQSTVDVDRSAEIGDTVGATILQETVAAINGGTDATDLASSKDENNADVVFDYFPTIVADDYLNDDEFKDIYRYLTGSDFLGNDKDYRQVLLIADQYFVKDNLLYKVGILRNTKFSRIHPVVERLCIPKIHRHTLLKYYHDNFGHPAVERLFLSMYSVIYWKTMYMDVKDFCKTCDVCHKSKRDFAHRTRPLNPLPVAQGPFKI